MTRGSVIIPSVILVAGARALAMSASSFWAGILRCSGTSPAFRSPARRKARRVCARCLTVPQPLLDRADELIE